MSARHVLAPASQTGETDPPAAYTRAQCKAAAVACEGGEGPVSECRTRRYLACSPFHLQRHRFTPDSANKMQRFMSPMYQGPSRGDHVTSSGCLGDLLGLRRFRWAAPRC